MRCVPADRQRPAATAVHRIAPALALVLTLAVAGCSSPEYVAPRPDASTGRVDAAAASATLDALRDALRDGDPAAARALGGGPGGADLMVALVANTAAIGLSDVTFAYVTETGRTAGRDGWDATVDVTWRVDGVDRASARAEVPFSFVDGGRRVAGVGASGATTSARANGARVPLWLAGPVDVRRVPGALVVAAGSRPAAELDDLGSQAARAVTRVRAVIGEQGSGLVVEVPADGAGLVRALGVPAGTYDAIAAVTAPVDGSQAPGTPVHVFVNPDVFDRLDPVASQVVMTHEAVHALTGAPLSRSAPLWLVEGFADYVALRDVDLPIARTAGQVLAQVRADGPPAALPADTDFGTGSTHLGAVYEAAWQVSVTLAQRRDEAALIGFYDRVLGGAKVEPELERTFGWSTARLTAAWRQRLEGLAGTAGRG